MPVTTETYLTYEEELGRLHQISGLLVPPLTVGAIGFFQVFPEWLTQGRRPAAERYSVVLPDPSLNLSLPYPRDEISLALSIAHGKTPSDSEILAESEDYSLPRELLDRPVTALSGGERMLLSLCKAALIARHNGRLCLCSPFFWLDQTNQGVVGKLLNNHDQRGGDANLLTLEGEQVTSPLSRSPHAAATPPLTWHLRIRTLSVHFPSAAFPRPTDGKTISYEAENETLPLRSPTLIAGSNGTGKTTLAKLLAGMLKPATGQVYAITAGFSGTARLLLQDSLSQLFSETATEHLERVFKFDSERRKEARKLLRQLEDECGTRLAESMPDLALGNRDSPRTVFQCKLTLAVERLMSGTPLLILDEPGWCLSRPVARVFVEVIAAAAAEKNIAIAIISHQADWWTDLVQDTIYLQPFRNSDRVLVSAERSSA